MYKPITANPALFRERSLSRSLRCRHPLATASMLGVALLAGHGALAQDGAVEEIEEVTINGSRIQRDGYSAPTPVSVLNSDEIDAVVNDLLEDKERIVALRQAASRSVAAFDARQKAVDIMISLGLRSPV